MTEFFAIFFLALIVIGVHEFGHYFAGLLCGIPADEMSVRLLTFPQHVAIRDGDEWCSPVADMPRYIELTSRYLTTETAAFIYVSGGLVGEGIFTTAVTLLAVTLDFKFIAFWLPAMSLWVYVINVLFMDLPWAWLFGHPRGDTSGLWGLARLPTVLLTAAMLGLRAGLVWFVLWRG